MVDLVAEEEVLVEEAQWWLVKTIIFDLDGTLIDSLEDIAVCMNQVLKIKFSIHKMEDYRYFVGGGISVLVDNALKGYSNEIKMKLQKI